MAKCASCGNDYDNAFQVVMAGQTYTFDSFECAIHKLAPACPQCGVRIVGHGVQAGETVFCCQHCASMQGVTGLEDRVSAP